MVFLPERAPSWMAIHLGGIVFGLVKDVDTVFIAEKHLQID